MSPSIKRAGIPAWSLSMLVLGMFIEAMAQSIQGTAWNAVELYGTAVPAQSSSGDRQLYLVFGADGRVSAADGCNRLTGPYAATATDITFGQIAETQSACPQTEETAKRFRAALTGASHWRIVMGRLEFYGETGKPLAIFEQRPATSGGPVTLKAQHGNWSGSRAPTVAR
jgi:copper homeostasis protein (lipoprotein)